MKRNKHHKDYGEYFWSDRISGNFVLAVVIIVIALIVEGVSWVIDKL